MRVPIEWLREFIPHSGLWLAANGSKSGFAEAKDAGLDPETLARRLTMAGLEVEAIERPEEGLSLSIKGSCDMPYVFEVNVTPNRPDCLSILGMAREVSATSGMPIRLPEVSIKDEKDFGFDVEIADPELCHRYSGRVINGVRIAESPEWLKKRLDAVGMRPINNVVDITNYVLMELGQPLHAFDLDLLKGKIIVKKAGSEAKITTLDGVDRSLPEESLLIWDEAKPVAVAGVMGGAETEVFASTKNIFLESAWFAPYSVRRTSKALGLRSESSYRFERGVDIENIALALDRAATLIAEICGGEVGRRIDVYPTKFVPSEIKTSQEKINKVLGTDISSEEISECLKRLGIAATAEDGYITAIQPSFRPDIAVEADIIEEVARIYGYEKIPTVMPCASLSSEGVSKKRKLSSKIKDTMRVLGYDEAINYSFMNSRMLDVLCIPSGDERRNAVGIKNPLRTEDSLLRTTLIPSLVENFRHNFFRGVKDIGIFELSRIFVDVNEALPREDLKLGGVYYMEKAPNLWPILWKEQSGEFYIVKGALESLLSELKIKAIGFKPSGEPFLHPGKSADIYLEGNKIGYMGVLSPPVVERLDIKQKISVVVFELDAEKIIETSPERLSYEPVPKFPYVERDIALIVGDSVRADEILALIGSYSAEVIEDAFVFDLYRGANIPEGKKSLGFGVRYRSKERTLTDEEVEKTHSGLVEHLVQKTGGEIRK